MASTRSIRRWRNQRLYPYVMSGNRDRDTIVGIDQFLMCLFLIAWPEAKSDEIAAFLANNGSGKVYSRSQISTRMVQLKLSKKIVSTEAHQAYSPLNLLKRHLFWSEAPPFGVAGADRRRMIDVDECGIEIQRVNRKYGHSAVGIRIVRPGHYSKDTKLTVILAIEPGDPALPPHVHGSTVNPRRWYRILMKAGTSTFEFNNFLEMVCNDLLNYHPPGQVGNQSRIFLWDNLSSHCAPLIHQTVEGTFNHLIIRRPPYRPRDAPIEYVFCQLISGLQRRTFDVENLVDLIQQIQNVITNLNGFNNLFGSIGY